MVGYIKVVTPTKLYSKITILNTCLPMSPFPFYCLPMILCIQLCIVGNLLAIHASFGRVHGVCLVCQIQLDGFQFSVEASSMTNCNFSPINGNSDKEVGWVGVSVQPL